MKKLLNASCLFVVTLSTVSCITPRVSPNPSTPAALFQFKLDGVTPIGVRDWTDETGAIFKGMVKSGRGAQYRLAVEIKPIGTAFTNTPTALSAPTDYGTTAEVTVPLWKSTHHWQAWGIDKDGGVGQAASFPTSKSNRENASDIEATYAGTMYYISVLGNDATGTPDNPSLPYRSPLGAGAGAFSDIPADLTGGPGDHVMQFMDSSTYGQLTISAKTTDATHRIILRAAAGTKPTMDADHTADGSAGNVTNNVTLKILASNVVVKGLRFTNTNLAIEFESGWHREQMVRLMGSASVVEGCFFDGNGRTPTINDRWFEICGTATDNLISGNRFDYSGGKAQLYIGQTCQGLETPGAQTIRNNVFTRFGQGSTGVSGALNFGAGIGTLAGNGSIVENNTFWNNGGNAHGLLDTNGSSLTVRNNIFSAITGSDIYAVGCNAETGVSSGVAYDSIMFGNTNNNEADCPGAGWTLSTYYTDNPHFVNPGATPPDLHVESTGGSRRNNSATWTIDSRCSVAIDKASATDTYDLEPAPNGGRRNIGAYGNTPEASKSCNPM